MAYDKKYPEIDDFILDFDKGQEDRIDKGFKSLSIPFATISTEWFTSASTSEVYSTYNSESLWSPDIRINISGNKNNLHIDDVGTYHFIFTRTINNRSKGKGNEVLARVRSVSDSDVYGQIIKFSTDNRNTYTHSGLVVVRSAGGGLAFSTECSASGELFFQDGRLTLLKIK